jgi:hypothetical protein
MLEGKAIEADDRCVIFTNYVFFGLDKEKETKVLAYILRQANSWSGVLSK